MKSRRLCRTILAVAAVAAAGLLANLGIAVLCAAFSPPSTRWFFVADDDHAWLFGTGWTLPADQHIKRRTYRGVGLTIVEMHADREYLPSRSMAAGTGVAQRIHAGFPFRSFAGGIVWSSPVPENAPQYVTSVPLSTPSRTTHARVAPYLPQWPGILANTLLYAAILWFGIRGLMLHLSSRRATCRGL